MPRINYGVPYKGSKSMIAEWVVSHVPECATFFDVFAGGCAITDCILRKVRAKHVIANDLDPMPVKCFDMAVRGGFADEDRWISREAFYALKDIDPYVRFCFSFGNSANGFAYSRTIEPYKRAVHYVLVHDYWDDFDSLCPEVCNACRAALNGITDRKERRLRFQPTLTNRVKELSGDNWFAPIVQDNPLYRTIRTKIPKRDLVDGNGGAHLEGACRLQSPEPTFETSNLDYRALTERILMTDDAFVYCDPPYRGTQGYGEFDYDAVLDWAFEVGRKRPLLISEYAIDHDGFIEVDTKQKRSSFNAATYKNVTEKLYTVKGGVYAKKNNIR